MALPKSRAPAVKVFIASASSQFGSRPQWLNDFRLMQATAPSLRAERDLRFVRNDSDRPGAGLRRELDRHRTEAAGAAPDEYHIALAHRVRRPPEQHPVGRGAHQRRRGCLLPGQVLRLWHALVRLHLRELRERTPGRLITPDPERRVEHRVIARHHLRRIDVPRPAVDNDLVADLDALYCRPGLPHDPGSVRPADVVVPGLAGLLPRPDDVHRRAKASPDVVVVHPGRHHVDEHFVRPDFRRFDHLGLECLDRLPEPRLADHLGMHPRGHVPQRRRFADGVQVFQSLGAHRILRASGLGPCRLLGGLSPEGWYPSAIGP